jgi:small subunit ribosomal protein S16
VVVADHRRARDGRYLERVGFYNPIASGPEVYLQLNNERVGYWLSKGAQPSERVQDLMKEFTRLGEVTGAQYTEKTAAKNAKKAKRRAAKKVKAAEEKAAA